MTALQIGSLVGSVIPGLVTAAISGLAIWKQRTSLRGKVIALEMVIAFARSVILVIHGVLIVNVLFLHFLSLYGIALSLGTACVLGFVVAYYTQHSIRRFFTSVAFASVFCVLLLSCYAGVGWDNPIVTAVIDTSFRLIEPRDFQFVQESLAEGTISPAHAQAYRRYSAVAAALRFCLLFMLCLPALVAARNCFERSDVRPRRLNAAGRLCTRGYPDVPLLNT